MTVTVDGMVLLLKTRRRRSQLHHYWTGRRCMRRCSGESSCCSVEDSPSLTLSKWVVGVAERVLSSTSQNLLSVLAFWRLLGIILTGWLS